MTDAQIIGSIIGLFGFVAVLFGLYKKLVSIKDAEINLLKTKIKELENAAPDILLERVQIRFKAAQEEFERLLEEKQVEERIKKLHLEQIFSMAEQIKKLQQRLQSWHSRDPMLVKGYADFESPELFIEVWDMVTVGRESEIVDDTVKIIK